MVIKINTIHLEVESWQLAIKKLGRTTEFSCLGVAVVLSMQSTTSSSQKELTNIDWSREENGNFRSKREPCNPQGAFLVRQNMADRLQRQVRERHANNSAHCQLGFFYVLLRHPGQAEHWGWHFPPRGQRLDHFLISLSLQKQGLITFLPSGFFTVSSQSQVWLLIRKSLW